MMIWLSNIKTCGPIDWNNKNNLYIGRANKYVGLAESKWCNPFYMKNEGDRTRVLKLYLEHVIGSNLPLDLHEIDDKTLFCWCHPKKCHGQILILLRYLQLEDRLEDWKEIYRWIEQ